MALYLNRHYCQAVQVSLFFATNRIYFLASHPIRSEDTTKKVSMPSQDFKLWLTKQKLASGLAK